MEFINEFLTTYGTQILQAVLTAIAGYLGIIIKRIYVKYVNDQTKKNVVNTCVKAVEQIYKNLHGDEKLNKCTESVSEILSSKGIQITDLEIRMLIESAVNEFNDGFHK